MSSFGNFNLSLPDFLSLDVLDETKESCEGYVDLDIVPSMFDQEMEIPQHKIKLPTPSTTDTKTISEHVQSLPGRDDVQNFINDQENKNTLKKTLSDIKKLDKFMSEKGEKRPLHKIPMEELDQHIASFIMTVKKPDGEDYEPTSIRNMISSFDRKLVRQGYQYRIISTTTNAFHLTRETLKAKLKLLKKRGKGNRPKEAEALSDDDINVLYERKQLGKLTPVSLINTLWLNNCLHFGMRGITEHYELRWGDVVLTHYGEEEYLLLNERQTKTRTGENTSDVRKAKPKIYPLPNSDRDPIEVYKLYAAKRPSNFSSPDTPFYLAPRTVSVSSDSDQWFLRQKIGVRKLSALMKQMCEKAGLSGKRLTNHSARKHLVQKLRDNDVQPTDIMQITGHKNIQSVMNYSTISQANQKKCSNILARNFTCNKNEEAYQQGETHQDVTPCPSSSGRLNNDNPHHTVEIPSAGIATPPTVPAHNIPNLTISTTNNTAVTPLFYEAVLNIGTLNVYSTQSPFNPNN